MKLLKKFLRDLERFDLLPHVAEKTVVVGVSGGADSLCLLHLLKCAAPHLAATLHVATLDHGLRGEASAADAAFVMQTAEAWGIPAHHGHIDVQAVARKHHLGIEEAARQARYTFLAQVTGEIGASTIAVGHNADDQAETILMHLIRGSGLGGLRGMLPATPLGSYHLLPGAPPANGMTLIRPLLDISRAEIEAYCADHNLQPRQDATNMETTYFRNRLRHVVLPLLETLNPGIRRILARTGHILAADHRLLERIAADSFDKALRKRTDSAIVFDRDYFRSSAVDTAIRRSLIREAVHLLAPELRDIGFVSVEHALTVALHGSTGREATLPGGITLRVTYDAIVLSRPQAARHHTDWPWLEPGTEIKVKVPGEIYLPDTGWTLHTRWLQPKENPAEFFRQPFTAVLALPANTRLTLRTRRPGERFAPQGMQGHTQKLSDTLINARVPAEQRDRLPLLTINGQTAWFIIGSRSRIAEPFAVRESSQRILLARWLKNPCIT